MRTPWGSKRVPKTDTKSTCGLGGHVMGEGRLVSRINPRTHSSPVLVHLKKKIDLWPPGAHGDAKVMKNGVPGVAFRCNLEHFGCRFERYFEPLPRHVSSNIDCRNIWKLLDMRAQSISSCEEIRLGW